ncbi:MAG: hypothetical protein JWO06_1271 [Bacteroidota bacterium]|nr:hypothetical protein [Bacteroidota bacterium]
MKKNLHLPEIICCVFFSICFFYSPLTYGQCTNADFENGSFSGWTGTYGTDACNGTVLFGICLGCTIADPLQYSGFNQGPNDDPPSDASTQYNQVICTSAGGNDANLLSLGATLPTVWPGSGGYSARIGNMWQDVGNGNGDGEAISYSYTVTPASCNFTYHYAVVLNDGGHASGEQPYFNIKMTDGNGADITCADYQVDASTAQTIGGFNIISAAAVYWKPWTTVFIPLNNYMGQTVKITFTTRSCMPSGCAGSHYAYAYIDAECGPLALVASSPTVCGGTGVTLTAPSGAATYSWSGSGIVGPTNNQTVFLNQGGGRVTVVMTTFGDVPCTFSLDTIIPASPNSPSANFSFGNTCLGSPTTFTDLSTPSGQITGWSWDFNNDGIPDATGQNPSYTFLSAGTFPVKLTVTWPPCTADTTINVVVGPPPTSTFTVTGPVCAGQTSTITYTGNGTGVNTYTWNFDGGTIISGSGAGPYQVNWNTAGVKNITLIVAAGNCVSALTTVPVTVTAFPGLTLSPNTSICAGGNTTLTVSGATTYTWAPAATLSSSTAPTVVATPATTTTYTVTGNTSSCTVTDIVTVSVTPVPTSTFTASSPVCTGQNSTITFTGVASGTAVYTWNFAGGTVVSGTGAGPYTVNWSTAGTKNITLSISDNGCPSTLTTVPVTVNPGPSSTFTATSPICTGQNSTITFTGTASGTAVYSWNFSGGTIVSGSGAGPYQISWASGGNENVTLSITDNGCTSPLTTQVVIVSAYPTSTFTTVSPICAAQNSTITFTGTASANAIYTWNFGGGTVVSGSNQGPYQVTWPSAGNPNITLQVTDNGCPSTVTTVPVTVNPYPTASFTTVAPLCTGQTSTITYTGTGTALATYTWDFDGGSPPTGNTAGPFSVSWSTAGSKNVTLIVTENGCSSPITDSVITVYPIPTSTFTAVSPVCVGQNSDINYTGTATANATYTWDFSGGTISSGGNQGPYQVNWAIAGPENITLTVTENGCTSLPTTETVDINAIPVSDAGPDVSFCSGSSMPIGTASTAGYTYNWLPANGLSSSTISNPVANGTNTNNAVLVTTYIVTTTNSNCSTSDSVIVTIYPVPVAAFTPPVGQCFTGNTFNFINGGTFLPGATFAWTFGANGTPATSTTQDQTVTFSAIGSQSISLTISQDGCVSNTYTNTVDVYPMPTASFATDTFVGCENFPVCFVNNSVANSPAQYDWNFGDGNTSSAQAPCNTYVAPGVYTVALQVTSADGCKDATSVPDMITVIANPKAVFTTSATVIQLPQQKTIDLFNDSRNAVNYLWTFGSLGNSTAFAPQLVFSDSGTYPIVLRAYNVLGCVDSIGETVYVLPPTNYFIPNVFTPNGDGNNDDFYIYTQEGVRVIKFQVFDRWGEKVHDGTYPWNGTYKGQPSPPAVYVYYCELGLAGETIAIKGKGSVTLIR